MGKDFNEIEPDAKIVWQWKNPNPKKQRISHNEAEEYVIIEEEKANSGIVVYGQFNGKWSANPWSVRAVIKHLRTANAKLRERYKDYERLWEIADQDSCDGDCDLSPPYEKCPEHIAKSTINECGEIRDYALQEIDQALKKGE